MRRAPALVCLIVLAAAGAMLAQEPPDEATREPAPDHALWMPEGYRLLSLEERQALPKEEWTAIGTRNTTLLREVARAMTEEERQATVRRLGAYAQNHKLADYERQYVAMASMFLLGAAGAEQGEKRKAERDARIEKLVRDQETATRGFSGEVEPVQKEAAAIRELIGKPNQDPAVLYLRVLRPLRARPWNQDTRVTLEKIVRGKDELVEALLKFCAARQNEQSSEGAWFSLEAYVRLTMRDDEAAGRRLFAAAVQKNARDLDSRIYPLLLAEIDGDQAAVARLRPRALEAWPKPEALDQTLFAYVETLPLFLQARAHDSFEKKFTEAHPADWDSRLSRLWDALQDNPHDLRRNERLPEIGREADAVLVLPASILPQEYRMQFQAITLLVRARLGQCDEVEAQLPVLEQAIVQASPRLPDGNGPPPPRAAKDVQELRRGVSQLDAFRARIERYLATKSLEELPGLEDIPETERRAAVEEALGELEKYRRDAASRLGAGGDDASIAAAWTRDERREWEKEHRLDAAPQYDWPTKVERFRIRVRQAEGKCLLEHGELDRAIRVLKPCFGDARNLHYDCVQPLLDAGILRANKNDPAAAIRIFRLLQPLVREESGLSQLRAAIERVAPGSLPAPAPSSAPTPARPAA